VKKTTAVLYFGGTTLSVTVASRGLGDSFIIHARETCEYNGIIDGEFVDAANLYSVVSETVKTALGSNSAKIDTIHIGVPHAFCDCFVSSSALNFEKPRKISQKDITKLINSVNHSDPNRTVVKRSAIYYRTDGGRAYLNALGLLAKNVEARISLLTVSNYFINTMRSCLGLGFKLDFIPCALAESLYLIGEETRDQTAVMISCGMFSTAVSVCCGDSLMYLKSFEQGIAHIINDVSTVLGVNFQTANQLVGEALLSIKMGENDNYEISSGGKKQKFSALAVNDIIKGRMEVMADHIVRIAATADKNILNTNSVFICGGNMDAISGARDFLSKAIGTYIKECICPLTHQNNDKLTQDAVINMSFQG